jgi:hypothetical protein
MLFCPNCHKGKFESEWGTFSAICKSCENELKDKTLVKLEACALCDVEYLAKEMDIFQSKFICKDCIKELKEEF